MGFNSAFKGLIGSWVGPQKPRADLEHLQKNIILAYFRPIQQTFNNIINKCYMFRSLIDDIIKILLFDGNTG